MLDVKPELLARLRVAEAQVEHLESAVKSQESLANRLALAMEAADQARVQLAQLQAAESSRRTLRSAVRRARRHVMRDKVSTVPPPLVEPMSGWSGTERLMTDNRYQQWIDLYDTLDSSARARILAEVEALPSRPLVSIVFPVYNAPEDYLRQAIESVREQMYTNWELCISDDRSTEPHVAKILDEYVTLDDRIRLVLRAENGHISASSNSALELARRRVDLPDGP